MNLNAYDSCSTQIDKTKSWIDVKKKRLLSREIKFRKYFTICKRYNTYYTDNDYFIVLLDDKIKNYKCHNTNLDNYGRIRINLGEIWNVCSLQYVEDNVNINLELVEHTDDGDIYKIDV